MNITLHILVLNSLKSLLEKLTTPAFNKPNKMLSEASIGQHFRHIIEFYQCCLFESKNGIVNYDLRKRTKVLEEDPNEGIHAIDKVLNVLKAMDFSENKAFRFCGDVTQENKDPFIDSTFFRELIYCMDHCIHHQSLIKIALIEQNLVHLIDADFGVAFSTLAYRKKCV